MKKIILIVDDSGFSRNIMKKAIESIGYATITAANGTEAIKHYAAERPDAVTMDLLMPDMDGLEAVREIIKIDSNAKVIICSTDKQKFRQEDAREAGAVGFVPKPVDSEILAKTFSALFGE